MGTKNKQRRRAKKSERVRAARNRTSGSPWTSSDNGAFAGSAGGARERAAEQQVGSLIETAVHAECAGRTDRAKLLDRLVAGEEPGGRTLIAHMLRYKLRITINTAKADNWEVADLVEVVRRKASAAAARVVSGARTVDATAETWATDVRGAIDVLFVLDHLPPLGDLGAVGRRSGPRPTVAAAGAGADRLKKIRALLAKAESTSFSEEADALSAKATELMTRYRIDRSALESENEFPSEVAARRIWIEEPYVVPKRMLLAEVAHANGCESVGSDLGFATVIGHPDDLEMTELLFTSLLVQATRQMTAIGNASRSDTRRSRSLMQTLAEDLASDQDVAKRIVDEIGASIRAERKRSPGFRRSFLIAFGTRIGKRLATAMATATDSATAELGDSFLPVLASQARAVQDAVTSLFGELSYTSVRVSDSEGYAAGVAAADLADLGVRDRLQPVG